MKYALLCGILLASIASCKKANEWLDVPRTKKDIVFSTLKDYQALLNKTSVFNLPFPTIGLTGSDNIYVNEQYIQSLPVVERNSYLWNRDIYEGRPSIEYGFGYQAINYSNIVINGIEEIGSTSSNASEYNFIKGQAHFFRAFYYFELASLFCKPFVAATAATTKGLCLRKKSDVNEIVKRSSVLETYNLILEDALAAVALLPGTATIKTQPSRSAAYLLLSRIYLNMADFEKAKDYADSSINISNALMDFNLVPSLNLPYRFPDFNGQNVEILFYAQGNLYQTLVPGDNVAYSLVDTLLYRQYEQNDLRRVYFYREFDSITVKFRGGYTGAMSNFCGLGVNEAFLNRAECHARMGDLVKAKEDLNTLLRNRYKMGTHVAYDSNDPDAVLRKVLLERRKELAFTGNIRWQDLRRFNLDPRLATSIYRKVNSVLIELKPNDNRYVYPFPQNEISLTGIEQNPR